MDLNQEVHGSRDNKNKRRRKEDRGKRRIKHEKNKGV